VWLTLFASVHFAIAAEAAFLTVFVTGLTSLAVLGTKIAWRVRQDVDVGAGLDRTPTFLARVYVAIAAYAADLTRG